MATAARIDILASYLPRRVVAKLVDGRESGPADRFPAAAMLTDLSGFTALAETLAQEGAAGAEKLTTILEHSLGGLVDMVLLSGGDVVHFAGDAVLAVWPRIEGEALAACARRAVACAVKAQSFIDGREAHPGHSLRARIGVGVGEVVLVDYGGGDLRRGWVAAGPAMRQVGVAEQAAAPGATVLSPELVRLLASSLRGPRMPDGSVVLDHLVGAVEEVFSRSASLGGGLAAARRSDGGSVSPGLEASIREYLPREVLDSVDAGQTEWLADLRSVTTLFANFPRLDPGLPAQEETVRSLIEATARVLKRQGGALNKVLVDEKGTTLVVAFGLAGLVHEDDAARALMAALRIEELAKEAGAQYGIGVSTGRAFCGSYGSAHRRDYTMLGDSVNLGARLMQSAEGDLWCDSATRRAAASRFEFTDLGSTRIRGKERVEPIARPRTALDTKGQLDVLLERAGRQDFTGGLDSLGFSAISMSLPPIDPGALGVAGEGPRMVGREEEEAQLAACLDALHRHEGGVVLVTGEAGMGKSLLVASLKKRAQDEGTRCLVGSANPVDAHEPYHGWREVLAQLFGIEALGPSEEARKRVEAAYEDGSALAPWVPLLESVLRLGFEETETTASMSGAQRADAVSDLLREALRRACVARPTVVVLDDCHWLDAASWRLALTVARSVPDLLLVLSMRPIDQDLPTPLEVLREGERTLRLTLSVLPAASIVELASRMLGAADLALGVRRLLVSRAAGNPFFCEELVSSLRETGSIEVVGGRASFRSGVEADTLDLPGTVRGVVDSRLGRLPPAEQLTIKVASVIGRVFGISALRRVHPTETDIGRLALQLDHLDQMDLCPIERVDPERQHVFKHAVVRDSCYELLVPSKRQALHREMALWLESGPGEGVQAQHARLAYHWQRAQEPVKALDHLERAGFGALREGADPDAVSILTQALELAEGLRPGAVSSIRLAELYRGLGTALHGAGHVERAADSLLRAMAAVGRPLPTGGAGWARRLVVEGLRQLSYRLLPSFLRPVARGARRDAMLVAGKAASWYANVSYFRVDALPWLAAGLISANLAEKGGDRSIGGAAYVNLANIFGTLHLRPIERVFMRLAEESPEPRIALIKDWSEAVVDLIHCDWDHARRTVDRGLRLGREVGDYWALGNGMTIKALIQYFTQPIERCLPLFDDVVVLTRERGNREQVGYGLIFSVPSLMSLGRLDRAEHQLAEAERGIGDFDYFSRVNFHGIRGGLRMRQGRMDEAVADIVEALRLFDHKPLMMFTYCASFGLIAEVAVAAAAQGGEVDGRSPAELAAIRKEALGNLAQGALPFRHFQPRSLMSRGTAAWTTGKQGTARRLWRKALKKAERYGMPGDRGRIHVEIARHEAPGSPERLEHEQAARAVLEPMGAAGDLSLTAPSPTAPPR